MSFSNAPIGARPPEPEGGPQFVLLVDDEPDITDALRGLLERALPHVRVRTANDPVQGLDILRSEPVDVIISDYRMPRMTGVQFLAEALHLRPDVPRVLLTAYPDLDVAMRSVNEARIEQLITKPVTPLALVEIVRDLLAEGRARKGRQLEFARMVGTVDRGVYDPDIGSIPPTPPG
ncbi:MAG: response regulator [Thermoplasmatota archaeon]